jgi:hypothetical protein
MKAASWHAIRCDQCRRVAQRILTIDHVAMRELLLQQIEACQQKRRISAL